MEDFERMVNEHYNFISAEPKKKVVKVVKKNDYVDKLKITAVAALAVILAAIPLTKMEIDRNNYNKLQTALGEKNSGTIEYVMGDSVEPTVTFEINGEKVTVSNNEMRAFVEKCVALNYDLEDSLNMSYIMEKAYIQDCEESRLPESNATRKIFYENKDEVLREYYQNADDKTVLNGDDFLNYFYSSDNLNVR